MVRAPSNPWFVSKQMTTDQPKGSHCPFCQSAINRGAIVCSGCGASHGYHSRGMVYSKEKTRFWGIVCLVIFAVSFVPLWLTQAGGAFWFILFIGLPALWGGLSAFVKLMRGPKWWRITEIR